MTGLIISVPIFILFSGGGGRWGTYTFSKSYLLATIQKEIELKKYQKISGEPFITILS